MKVVYAYQWIDKKALEGSTKESPWRNGIIVLRIAASQIRCSKPLFSVSFKAPQLVQPGVKAGWQSGRRNAGKCVSF